MSNSNVPILRVNLARDTDSTDPALAQHVVSGQMQFATQAKLVNYPDRPGEEGRAVVPEVAADLPIVSENGCSYTFTIRSGADAFRLSNGEVVTPEHFYAAFQRCMDPTMSSPGAGYMSVVAGAEQRRRGETSKVEGISLLAGNRLNIRLQHPVPDFLHRLAMPFYSAIPLDLPHDSTGVTKPPSAGPYYVADREIGKSITLRRNPHYRHGRPCAIEEIRYSVGHNEKESIREIEVGAADYVADGIPASEEGRLGQKFGLNKSQFMVRPALQLDYLALNGRRPLFADPWVRRAVNFAIDRTAILRARGAFAGTVATHILPPGMPGYREEHVYPVHAADPERAKREIPGYFSGGKAVIYTWDHLAGPTIGQVIRANLEAIGIESEVIAMPETEMHIRAGRKDEPFDICASGWTADYPDPNAFLNVLLDGGSIRDEYNANDCYFDDPSYNLKLREAARLEGAARWKMYGDLDIEIMQAAAPMVCCDNRCKRDFVSARVRGAFTHPVFGLDFCALSLES